MGVHRQRHRGRRPVAWLVSGALALGGCQSLDVLSGSPTSPPPPQTPSEQRLQQQTSDYNRTIVEGISLGAVAGAVLGALASSQSRGVGALIGLGVGALLGGLDAFGVAKQKERYATEQQRMVSMIDNLHQENQKLEALLATTKDVVADDKQRLAQVDDAYARKQATLAEAKQEHSRVEDHRQRLAAALAALQKRRDQYANAADWRSRAGADTTDVDLEITHLNEQIHSLEGDLADLDQMLAVSRVG